MTSTSDEGNIGKYEIIRVLGRGGMGEVLLAQDKALGRKVAIKRPYKSAMQESLARFQLEARAATLNHRNIPAVYELGVHDGLPFIAMEYVEGEPLDQVIASGVPLDLIVKLGIIEQVCSALEHAHQKGIIHRDIKPANVIVQPDGIVKIIDFGIAKMQSTDGNAGLTQTSQIIGSLHYIAPERFRGEIVDGRADIFSTGVMLYLLLTGSLPFPGAEATAAYKIVNESHTALTTYIHDYPPVLDSILDRALAKNPNQRYASAEDFADALHDVIDELKRNRVVQLFGDAERLTTERRFEPALDLLNEAMNLDPANTQVRKLRKFVREQQEKARRVESLRSLLARGEEALSGEKYSEAVTVFKEALDIDPSYPELAEKIRNAEEKKRVNDQIVAALAGAEAIRARDPNGAVRILENALQQNPQSLKLLAAHGSLSKQVQIEAQHAGLQELFDNARDALAMHNFSVVEELLSKAKSVDQAHPEIDRITAEMARIKGQEERQRILEEIQRRVYELVQANNFEQAAELVNRAIDKLPSESALHRLKAEISEHTHEVESKRVVDEVIARAREVGQTSPSDAFAMIQTALDTMPGEERLITYQKTLHQQVNEARCEDQYQHAIRAARDLMDGKQYEKAIATLENYELEFGSRPELGDFLAYAREEFAGRQSRAAVERCIAESRALMREERFDDAAKCIEAALQNVPDHPSLTNLLAEARGGQQSAHQKTDIVLKRVALLRDHNEIEEAINLLRQQLAATPTNASIAEQLNALVTSRGREQTIANAIAAAKQAALQGHFSSGIASLEAIQTGFGKSDEVTRSIQELQALRSQHSQEAVSRSIEMGRIALRNNDAQGAIAVLNSASAMVEFATQPAQQDWNRIRQSAKDMLTPTPPGTTSADSVPPPPDNAKSTLPPPFQPQILAIPPKRKSSGALMAVIAIVVLLALAAGGFAWWKLHPVAPAQAHLRITKAPPGSMVSIDHGTPHQVDASGQFTTAVPPGERLIEVSQDGFEPFSDKVTVGAGDTVNYPSVSLTKTPVVGTSGKLIPQGNVPDFRLIVDGDYRGLLHEGDQLSLEQGPHAVRYENADSSDFQEHALVIAANQELTDPFTLKAPKPPQVKVPPQNRPRVPTSNDAQLKPNTEIKSGSTKNKPIPDSSEAEADKIRDAHDRFEAAYASKSITQLKAEWLDIGKDRTDQMEDIFKRADTVLIHEKCNGQPTINGASADWRCTEIVQLNKNFFGPSPKKLTFSKIGTKWFLKDK